MQDDTETIKIDVGTAIARHPWTYKRGEIFPVEEIFNCNTYGYYMQFPSGLRTVYFRAEKVLPFMWGWEEMELESLTTQERKDELREIIENYDGEASMYLRGPPGRRLQQAVSAEPGVVSSPSGTESSLGSGDNEPIEPTFLAGQVWSRQAHKASHSYAAFQNHKRTPGSRSYQ